MLTPSSNTTLEPVTARMLSGLPEVSAHFGRFRVTEISLGEQALGQFQLEPMLAAAELLADARCRSICWNGTAGWLGFERDRELCRAIEARTRVRACSSVLAIEQIFRATGVARASAWSRPIPTRSLPRSGETSAPRASSSPARSISNQGQLRLLRDRARDDRRHGARGRGGLAAGDYRLRTNMDGASLTEGLEREVGIPIYDSIATAVRASLRTAGA